MPLPLLLLALGGGGVLTLAGGQLFNQKKDGTITVSKPGDDVVIKPELLALIGAGLAAWYFFGRK